MYAVQTTARRTEGRLEPPEGLVLLSPLISRSALFEDWKEFGYLGIWSGDTLTGSRTVPWVVPFSFDRRGRASVLVLGSRHVDDIVIAPN
jgi:hypothetical protein